MLVRSGPVAPGIAFITGGGRGLGNAIAVSFAKEGAAGVVIVDILDDDALQKGKENVESYGTKASLRGGRTSAVIGQDRTANQQLQCLAIRADVTVEADIEQAVAKAVAEFGRIDYAANFAGIIGPQQYMFELDAMEWQKTMVVNSTGVFLSTKHELRQMMKQDSIKVETGRVPQMGSIVNCASVNSLQSLAGAGPYTASKHAVNGITKAAALEARQYGIRVNAVSPGFLYTKMIEPLVEKGGQSASAIWSQFEARQGRPAAFEEVGDVVVLLSTPRMSLVNGHNLVIDGGFTINEGSSDAASIVAPTAT